MHYSLYIIHYLSSIICYQLSIIHYSLSIVHPTLIIIHYLLYTIHYRATGSLEILLGWNWLIACPSTDKVTTKDIHSIKGIEKNKKNAFLYFILWTGDMKCNVIIFFKYFLLNLSNVSILPECHSICVHHLCQLWALNDRHPSCSRTRSEIRSLLQIMTSLQVEPLNPCLWARVYSVAVSALVRGALSCR